MLAFNDWRIARCRGRYHHHDPLSLDQAPGSPVVKRVRVALCGRPATRERTVENRTVRKQHICATRHYPPLFFPPVRPPAVKSAEDLSSRINSTNHRPTLQSSSAVGIFARLPFVLKEIHSTAKAHGGRVTRHVPRTDGLTKEFFFSFLFLLLLPEI